jgi:hypothetical protein
MGDRQIAIRFVDDVRNTGHDFDGIGIRGDYKRGRPSADEIGVIGRPGVESKLVHVAYNADDRKPTRFGVERAEIDALSERISLRPVAPRHVLIDDDV